MFPWFNSHPETIIWIRKEITASGGIIEMGKSDMQDLSSVAARVVNQSILWNPLKNGRRKELWGWKKTEYITVSTYLSSLTIIGYLWSCWKLPECHFSHCLVVATLCDLWRNTRASQSAEGETGDVEMYDESLGTHMIQIWEAATLRNLALIIILAFSGIIWPFPVSHDWQQWKRATWRVLNTKNR